MTFKRGVIFVVLYVITFGIAKSEDNPLVTVKERTSNRIVIEWGGGSKQSVWERGKNSTLYKLKNNGCGLPDLCGSDLYMESYENVGCVLASRGHKYNSNYIPELGRYRTKEDSDCTFFDKDYFITDISKSFKFTADSVELIDPNFKKKRRPFKNYMLDVSKDGSRILTSIYAKKDNPYLTSFIIFNLEGRTAKRIIFLHHSRSAELLFGFIDDKDFIVLFNNSRLEKKSEYLDPVLGAVTRFDQNLVGKPVKFSHKSGYRLCADFVLNFNVNSKRVVISGDSAGTCGFIGWMVIEEWQDNGSLKPIYVEGSGDPGQHRNTIKDEVNLVNYGSGGIFSGELANNNESFFKVQSEKDLLKVFKHNRNGVAINDVIPEEGYLFPVWQKSYNGLADASATIYAYKEADYLHIELDVTDEKLVLSNENDLYNDHVELWLFTNSMKLEKSMNYTESYYLDSWIGQVHLSLSTNKVALLDNEKYTQVGIKSSVFQPAINNIKSEFNHTEKGYFQKLSIPFNSLPFYQLKDKQQCIGVMVDVVDVDDTNKQETLLTNNVWRKWGRRFGAPKVCFEIKEDLSAVRFVNKEGVTIDKSRNDMAVVVKDKQGYTPIQFNYLKPKAEPFSKIKPINYRQLNLVELPEAEVKKIQISKSCVIEKAFYQQEQQELVLLSVCPMPNTFAFISVVKLGDTPRFLIDQKSYFSGCYRHCGDDYPKQNTENLKYGILDDDINVIQIDHKAFFFSETKNASGDLVNHGFPKLAEEVNASIDLGNSRKIREPFNKTMLISEKPGYPSDKPIINITAPLVIADKILKLPPIVYKSPLFDYSSSNSNDIYCLEKEVIKNYIANGELKLPKTLALNCLSQYFDLRQLGSNVTELTIKTSDIPISNNILLKSVASLNVLADKTDNKPLDLKMFEAIQNLSLMGNRGRDYTRKTVKLNEDNNVKELFVDSAFDADIKGLNNVEKLSLTSCKRSWPKLPSLKTLIYQCNEHREIYRTLPDSQIVSLKFKGIFNQDFVNRIFEFPALKRLSLDSNSSRKKVVFSLPTSAEVLEELSLKLYHPEEIQVLESLRSLTKLKHLSLIINFKVVGGINSYLQLLKDLPLESFSLTNLYHDTNDEALDIPFNESLKKIQLSINGQIKKDIVFPRVVYADIKGSRTAFNDKDLEKMFPNLEKLDIYSFKNPFPNKTPKSLNKLAIASGVIEPGKQKYPKFDELTLLNAGTNQYSFFYINGLSAERYFYQYIRGNHKEMRQVKLVSYADFELQLLNSYDQERTKKILNSVLKDCNYGRNVKVADGEKSKNMLSITSSCVAKALWRVDVH